MLVLWKMLNGSTDTNKPPHQVYIEGYIDVNVHAIPSAIFNQTYVKKSATLMAIFVFSLAKPDLTFFRFNSPG